LSASVREVSGEVDVGKGLRAIRLARRRTLRDVAERAGLSESFLSQVERGRSSASIASLRRIADALGVSMADLFQPSGLAQPRVLRRDERPSLAFAWSSERTFTSSRKVTASATGAQLLTACRTPETKSRR
jgi:transcriptional regulator with XRE-family HTH domain